MPALVALAVILPLAAPLADEPSGVIGYYRFPTIHGQTVVFAAEGDLWQVPVEGGIAMRLTTHSGNESHARFSPDGKWLAFSAEYQGNVDVYVMPAGGGEPRRLTYHPSDDEVVAWRPDSSTVVFRSRRLSPNADENLFEVPLGGGHPMLVPLGVGALASFAPDGDRVAFNRMGSEFRTWKRYKGGCAPDLWLGNLRTKEFHRITDWEGTDSFPMWCGDRVYFVSDRTDRMNITSCRADGSDVRQHTDHRDYDVRWSDTDAGRIVYMLGGDLWLFDVETDEAHKLDIRLASDRVQRRPRFEKVAKTLASYELDRTGKQLALSSRGELWVSPTKEGLRRQLTHSSGIRERAPTFSPDGKKLALITDETGEQELAVLEVGGQHARTILSHRAQGWIFPPVWSPDGKQLAYADLTMTLFVVDVASGKISVIDHSEAAEIEEYAFAPDGKWLAYTLPAKGQRHAIFIYSLEKGTKASVSTSFTDDFEPAWDPEGKYLYFLSRRSYNPILCEIDFESAVVRATIPCAVILSEDGISPFLAREPPEEEEDGDEENEYEEDEDSETPPVEIDLDGIAQRVVQFPVEADNYSSLASAPGKVFYMSEPLLGVMEMPLFEEDEEPRRKLHVYDLEEKKDETFIDSLRDYTLSGDGKRIAWRVADEILVADTDSDPPDEIEEQLDPDELPLEIDPAAEWEQIFHEAWRLQRDFYWAENMGQVDWEGIRQRYAALLPRISTRDELNDLIGELIGELGSSHAYVFGGDTRDAEPVEVGLLGADLVFDEDARAYRFERVLRPEAWETDVEAPLTMTHAKVKEGEYLFAINGRDLSAQENVYARLAGLAAAEVLLTVGAAADRSDAREIQIKTLESEETLRYRDWCRRNREYIEMKSAGRIGYFHLPDMMGDGLVAFVRGFYPQVEKDALIIDARYNGGGMVSSMLIERLRREVWAYMQPRRGETATFPVRAHVGPKVVLTNYWAGSDGDVFPESFKLLELGSVIGTRTWGGVVGIRADKRFIDGGLSTQPECAWWEPKRGWDLENRGVEPDILIDVLPQDQLADHDPQLDRAIAELEGRLRDRPPLRPEPPPVPDKRSSR
ncbi:MAG: S41 family peptidase [Planctomycetota bacterium]